MLRATLLVCFFLPTTGRKCLCAQSASSFSDSYIAAATDLEAGAICVNGKCEINPDNQNQESLDKGEMPLCANFKNWVTSGQYCALDLPDRVNTCYTMSGLLRTEVCLCDTDYCDPKQPNAPPQFVETTTTTTQQTTTTTTTTQTTTTKPTTTTKEATTTTNTTISKTERKTTSRTTPATAPATKKEPATTPTTTKVPTTAERPGTTRNISTTTQPSTSPETTIPKTTNGPPTMIQSKAVEQPTTKNVAAPTLQPDETSVKVATRTTRAVATTKTTEENTTTVKQMLTTTAKEQTTVQPGTTSEIEIPAISEIPDIVYEDPVVFPPDSGYETKTTVQPRTVLTTKSEPDKPKAGSCGWFGRLQSRFSCGTIVIIIGLAAGLLALLGIVVGLKAFGKKIRPF